MTHRSRLSNLLLLFLLLATAACGPAQGPGGIALAQSDVQRVAAPAVSADDQSELAAGNQAFALELYRYLAARSDGNLFLSPHSISVALAMTYAGARGTTEAEMAQALHFTLPQDRLHGAFNGLDLALSRRGEGAEGKDGEGFRLHVVNALWGQRDYAFLQAFLDELARNYGAGMNLVDFVADAEAARKAINGWVTEQTEDRIKDLIPQGALDSLTRLVLTNAIYFNAAWAEPFDEAATQDGDFFLPDGTSVQVPLMQHIADYGYTRGEGYQVVELPYDGYELSMVILLPDEGAYAAFEQGLDPAQLGAILGALARQQVDLTMPRFETTARFSLSEALAALGMPEAFSDAADFSGMDGTRNLLISEVFHQAFVSVDEAGTEAAAATAVVMELKMAPMEPPEPQVVRVDRPFIYLIRDLQTGALLFVGRVLNPAE